MIPVKVQAALAANAEYCLQEWLPDGEPVGGEYVAPNPTREDATPGSFKINMEDGVWADFATDDKGGDLTSLYAYINGISDQRALKKRLERFVKDHGLAAGSPRASKPQVKTPKPAPEPVAEMVELPPDFDHEGNQVTGTFEYRDPDGNICFYVLRVEPEPGKKDTKPCRFLPSQNRWEWSYPPGKRTLYNADRITEGCTVLFGEGEKTADALSRLGIGVTSSGGSGRLYETDLEPLKQVAEVIVFPDADVPGVKYAAEVICYCEVHQIPVRILDVDALGWTDGEDAADHPELTLAEYEPHLLVVDDDWVTANQQSYDHGVLKACAQLDPVTYDRAKSRFCDALGIGKRAFDAAVKNYRTTEYPDDVGADLQDSESPVRIDGQWPDPVDGDELLGELVAVIQRYIVLSDHEAVSMAVWVVAAYLMDRFRVFPKLAVVSPERRCGKSTALEVLQGLCPRPLLASNISPSAVFRVIEAWQPTLLLDEADTFLRDPRSEMNGILNSGHTRVGAFVVRTMGDDFTPTKFSTWAPNVIAGIGVLTDTLMDRSIVVHLRRKLTHEKVDRLSLDFEDDHQPLRERINRWAHDNLSAIQEVEPPACGNDRAANNWMPLLSVATLIGGKWPERVLDAYTASNAEETTETIQVQLLQDIREVFDTKGVDRLHSQKLVDALLKLEERPWGEINRGAPMTTTKLAQLLKPFKVASKMTRIGETSRKGYTEGDFTDAFSRYLPR